MLYNSGSANPTKTILNRLKLSWYDIRKTKIKYHNGSKSIMVAQKRKKKLVVKIFENQLKLNSTNQDF